MEPLPLNSQLKRTFDGAIYTKTSFSQDTKKPCSWKSEYGNMFISDTAVYTNEQYKLLGEKS